MINGATCNGHDTSGCGQTPATAPAGFGANGIAIDQLTNQSLRHQHRGHQRHHDQRHHLQRHERQRLRRHTNRSHVGDYPGSISVDPAVGTAYVANIEGVSVIPLNH